MKIEHIKLEEGSSAEISKQGHQTQQVWPCSQRGRPS